MKKAKNNPKEKKGSGASQYRWALTVFCMAVTLSAALSLASESMLDGAGVVAALLILAAFILLGIVFDVLSFLIYGLILEHFKAVEVNYVILLISGAGIAVVAQLGDLIASLIKREHGVKDYGSLLPGHGGIMDRFDSVLAVSTVLMIICILCPPFT